MLIIDQFYRYTMIDIDHGGYFMVPNERRQKILSILQTREYISIHELAKQLYVSLPTVRRDLSYMEADGQVRRTHGGVTFIHPESDISPIALRNHEHMEEKEAIGKEAVKLLSDGESLFIDSSSTAYCFVKAIPKDMRLNVVTNGLYIAQSFHEHPHVHVELVGGQYDPHHACLIGAEASHFIQSRFADWFFVSANAMDTHCITSQSNIDIDLKQCMHTHAQQTILLMDDSKFLNTSFYKVFDLYDIDQLITNHLPSEMEDALIENQVLIKKAVQ